MREGVVVELDKTKKEIEDKRKTRRGGLQLLPIRGTGGDDNETDREPWTMI